MSKIRKKKYSEGLDENGRFAKGNKLGKGSKRVAYAKQLDEAIRIVEKEKRKSIFVHLVRRAFENDVVLNAFFKKIIPDLAQIHVTPEGAISVTFNMRDFRENKETKK